MFRTLLVLLGCLSLATCWTCPRTLPGQRTSIGLRNTVSSERTPPGVPLIYPGSGLVRLNVLGNNIVVVNTLEAATDLLEKRSANYSDRWVVCRLLQIFWLIRNARPEMIMLNEL